MRNEESERRLFGLNSRLARTTPNTSAAPNVWGATLYTTLPVVYPKLTLQPKTLIGRAGLEIHQHTSLT